MSLKSYNELKQDVRKADHELELLDQELSNTKDEITLESTKQQKLTKALTDHHNKLIDLTHRIKDMAKTKMDSQLQETEAQTRLKELEGLVAECGASLEEQEQEDQKQQEQLEKLRQELARVTETVKELEQRATDKQQQQ
ncbi:hypothetical protein BDB00DRAFT_836201 [Zychaea mexicana]|uniref:uncharacterized protein n=1 Tax=Zychaea mexicana TaxID=64656 RepID=UPI0022FE3E96|nr:uncharacterized protein BDB00DRAFT_836201 [Zychaea mexicana]KAI9490807.1 hypothetical protein BDB00DRAFT_836201 [Zychaea mexicana]